MEGNKDESEKCIALAEKYINTGNREKALKFLNKAEKLYPSQKAKSSTSLSLITVLLLFQSAILHLIESLTSH